METPKVPATVVQILVPADGALGRIRSGGGIVVAWLIGRPRRAGAWLHAMNDAEARWWHWDVSEHRGGLVRQYRDARFTELPHNPALRRDGLGDPLNPAPVQPA